MAFGGESTDPRTPLGSDDTTKGVCIFIREVSFGVIANWDGLTKGQTLGHVRIDHTVKCVAENEIPKDIDPRIIEFDIDEPPPNEHLNGQVVDYRERKVIQCGCCILPPSKSALTGGGGAANPPGAQEPPEPTDSCKKTWFAWTSDPPNVHPDYPTDENLIPAHASLLAHEAQDVQEDLKEWQDKTAPLEGGEGVPSSTNPSCAQIEAGGCCKPCIELICTGPGDWTRCGPSPPFGTI